MKRNLFFILTSFLLVTACTSAQGIKGSKNYITKNVPIENFHSIVVKGSPNVIYTQKPGKPTLEIYGSDNIVPLLETYVENGTLTVRFKKNTRMKETGKLEIRVSGAEIREALVQGSGDFTFANGLKSENELVVKVHGSGDVRGEKINCKNLSATVQGSGDLYLTSIRTDFLETRVQGSGDVKLSDIEALSAKATVQGSGDVVLSGSVDNAASYYVQGSGDIQASNLKATHVLAEVRGSGDIRCYAVKALKGGVYGSGDVGYKGNPEIVFTKEGLYKL